MLKENKKFFIAMVLPLLIIVGYAASKYISLYSGQEIVLEVPEPVDPVDLFRGNYVTLNYTINDISGYEIPLENPQYNDRIYSILEKGEKYWTIKNLSATKPEDLLPGEVCLKGRIQFSAAMPFEPSQAMIVPPEFISDSSRTATWGIEAFFAPEEIAKYVETGRQNQIIDAVVSVDDNCNPIVRALVMDGETIQLFK